MLYNSFSLCERYVNVKHAFYVYDLDIWVSLDYRETSGLALLAQLVERRIRNA